MALEEIVRILGGVTSRKLMVTRTLEPASGVAKSYRRYVLTLWELHRNRENEELFKTSLAGQVTGELKGELVHDTEREFIKELFNHIIGSGL